MTSGDKTTSAATSTWEIGDVLLNLYEVREFLGRGGMGTVYRVRHKAWGLDLAVKRPKPEVFASAQGAKLFENECETWIKLGLHPNIVTCFYARRIENIPHVFAEYVSGGTLSQAGRDGVLYRGTYDETLTRLLDYAIQFARGLLHAHEHNLIHHDVKPANVLITEDGELKVTDFGMAGAIAAASSETNGVHRSTANPRGTPLYASPEQARRETMTIATDIWSYGLSVLEMFVGDSTWMAGQTAPAALESYLNLGPERDDIPEMPDALAQLLAQCFQKPPADRPNGMKPILEVLESCYEAACGEPYSRGHQVPEEHSNDRLSNRAVTLLDLGNQTEAEKVWEQILAADSNHTEAVYNQSLHYWRTGRLTDMSVLKRLDHLRDLSPKAWAPLYQIAEVQIERGDTDGALRALHAAKSTRVEKHEFRSVRDAAQEWAKTGRNIARAFGDHPGPVTAAAISWDGRIALSAAGPAGGNADIYLWAGGTGKLVRAFGGHSGSIRALDLSGDAKFAVSGGEDGAAHIWHLHSGRIARTLSNHDGPVNAVRFTEDGHGILTADGGGVARLWNIASGECERVFSGHRGPIAALCLAEFGRAFMTVGQDCMACFWELKTGKPVRTFKSEGGPLSAAAISGDRRYAVGASEDGYIQVWDLRTGKTSGAKRAHGQAILSIALSKQGRNALTSAGDGKFRLWDMRSGRCITTLPGNAPIAMTGDSQHALTADEATGLQLWRIRCDRDEYVAPYMLCRAGTTLMKHKRAVSNQDGGESA